MPTKPGDNTAGTPHNNTPGTPHNQDTGSNLINSRELL